MRSRWIRSTSLPLPGVPDELADARDERPSGKDSRSRDTRTGAEHDRDRVLYCSGFRRLAEVTQVVGTGELVLFHNRLTHSIKVAQIGRRLAERLARTAPGHALYLSGGISPDVVETACLAHDLGHPPFGHVGEAELQNQLTLYDSYHSPSNGLDSFEGNAQSFRIVNKLATRGGEDDLGLDLTRATLRAILKYPWYYDDLQHRPKSQTKWGAYRSEQMAFDHALTGHTPGTRGVEATLMDWADDVAYAV
ncbi:MAG: dGTP triphosphohydrolase, partial [Candidatus Dormibacteria bacterium]